MPIFTISSVTGKDLDLLTRFLYVLPPSISVKEKERLEQVKNNIFFFSIVKLAFIWFIFCLFRSVANFKLMKFSKYLILVQ